MKVYFNNLTPETQTAFTEKYGISPEEVGGFPIGSIDGTLHIEYIDELKEILGEDTFNNKVETFLQDAFPDGDRSIKYWRCSYDDEISVDTLLEGFKEYVRLEPEEEFGQFLDNYLFDEYHVFYNDMLWDSAKSYAKDFMAYITDDIGVALNGREWTFDEDQLLYDIGDYFVSVEGLEFDFLDEIKPRAIKLNIGISTPMEQNFDHGSIHDMVSMINGYDATYGVNYGSFKDYNKEDVLEACNNGLTYLIQQQGYSINNLHTPNGNPFLESVVVEMDNFHNIMGRLTVLTTVDYDTFVDFAKASIDKEDRYKSFTFGKDSTVGIFNKWLGSGSVFEIELEKPFTIPAEYVSDMQIELGRSADHWQGYCADEVYGFVGSSWQVIAEKSEETVLSLNEKALSQDIDKCIEDEKDIARELDDISSRSEDYETDEDYTL